MDLARAKTGLATRITQRIAELGTSPELVADDLDDISDRTVRRMMSGELGQLAKLVVVAAKLDRSLSWMVGEELPDYPVNAEPLIRLSRQLTQSNIDALCVMAKELITSEAEAAARRPLPRAAEDESEYRASPPAEEGAASQSTDTGAGA